MEWKDPPNDRQTEMQNTRCEWNEHRIDGENGTRNGTETGEHYGS